MEPKKTSIVWVKRYARFFVLLLSFLTTLTAQAERPAAVVEVSSARTQQVAPTIWVPGTVISRQDARIATEVAGYLLSAAEVGDRVEQGQTVGTLNTRLLRLSLRNSEAEIKRLEANLAYLHRQVKRVQQLAKASNTAESELDQLMMQRDMLTQQVVVAEVERDRILYDLERSQIKAPFSGVVVERAVEPGEYINQGDELVRLVNLDNIEVRAQAPIGVSHYVREGSLVQVKNDDLEQTTLLRRIVPVGDERSRMLEVRIQLQEAGWVVGEAVRVELANGPSQTALTVPRDALILREQQAYVYRVGPDNIAHRVRVVTGNGAGSAIAVVGEIAEGDPVIVRGGERLQDEQPVKVLREVSQSP